MSKDEIKIVSSRDVDSINTQINNAIKEGFELHNPLIVNLAASAIKNEFNNIELPAKALYTQMLIRRAKP